MLMELFGIDAEAARITAYLVQCNEPAIAVEHRVLGAFRHHRRGDLLKLSSDTLLGQLRNMADHVFVAGGRAKMSKHSVRGGDVAGLLGRFKLLQEKAQARTGKLFPVVAIFERMSNQWREEQNRCLREIERLQAADRSYMDEGVQLLELAQNAQRLFAKQEPREKRRLFNFLLSNCTWEDGEVAAPSANPLIC
jgi:hypothetical protein